MTKWPLRHSSQNLGRIRYSQAEDSGARGEAEAVEEAASSKLRGNGVRVGKTLQRQSGRTRGIWSDAIEFGRKFMLFSELDGAELRKLILEASEELK